jgi:cellulose 1,4-beta-cellobiosidase
VTLKDCTCLPLLQANSVGWTPSTTDVNAGSGMYGTCCSELDIWEANKMSEAYTPHPCSVTGQTRCSGIACGDQSAGQRYDGVCDKDGCDFNSYRMGNTSFYGPGMIVDTTKPITVVTQFITADGTATGTLSAIKRFYVQNGVVIPNSVSNIAGVPAQNYVSDSWCVAQKTAFGDTNSFTAKGGLTTMGQSMDRGQVLVLSIWDDHAVDMLWLDSTYPTNSTSPGAARGSCAITSGQPTDVEANSPNSSVTFSNIKIGPIGSTFSGSTGGGGGGGTSTSSVAASKTSTTSKAASSTASSGGGQAQHWGQCGGIGWTGPTQCVSPFTCQVNNPWYSQCL